MKIWKRISVSALLLMVLGIFSCEDPNGPGSEFTVTVTGKVVRLLNPSGIDSIVLTMTPPFKRDTVDSDGSFSFTFTSKEDNEITAEFNLSHINLSYYDTMYTGIYSRTKNKLDLGELKMRGKSSSLDSQVTGRPSFRPKVVTFIRSTFPVISIGGAGNDITSLTFEVRDSVGNPVDANNKAVVRFQRIPAVDSFFVLNRTSAVTNSLGQVVVQLQAGKKAGIAQVLAVYIDTVRHDTIKSPIVSVTIAGGLPVFSRFSIGSEKANVPGLVKYNIRNTITATVGDTFGNPVQKGTVVYFSTTGGIIQPYATTNDDGTVSVDLITANPAPTKGLAIITATVGTPGSPNTGGNTAKHVDEAVIIKGLKNKKSSAATLTSKITRSNAPMATIQKKVGVLFSGSPIVKLLDALSTIPHLSTKTIRFTVADSNGNPMSQGTTIKVTGVGFDTLGADLSGDVLYTMVDTYDSTFTKFSITLKDNRTKNLELNIPVGITFEVTGENGNLKETYWTSLESAGSGGGKVGSLAMVTTTVDTLVVNGAGGKTVDSVRVRVRDANNNLSAGIPVTFEIVKTVGGGEYLSKLSATTNTSGIATVGIHSGIRAGLVQIQASYNKNESSIKSDLKSFYIKTGSIASLNLVSASTTSLSVKGGGGNESAILIFEAKDSLGNAIDGPNAANITITMQGDTSEARVNPSIVKTDPNNGRVTINLTAGKKSGIILVTATAKSGTVKSNPVQISVSGGQPVISRFTLSTQKVNLPAGVQLNLSNTITAVLGDTFGNPVQTGTVVYFSTNGGIIQPAAATSNTGLVSVGLVTGNPFPPVGIATVTASVGTSSSTTTGVQIIDESVIVKPLRSKLATKSLEKLESEKASSVIKKSVNIVFSGAPIITSSDTLFNVDPANPKDIQITVADINGNPMSEGTIVKVTGVGLDTTGAVLSGNTLMTIPDTDDKNYTKFNISVADKRTKNLDKDVKLLLDIEVSGPNGNKKKTIVGHLVAQGSAGGKVGSITMDTTAIGPLVVNGAGTPTTGLVKALVLDSDNKPSAGIPLTFEMVKTVGGGEYLSSSTATTNASGIASVTFHSGIRSGLIQVQASYNTGETSIKSDIKSFLIKTGSIASLNLVSASTTSLSVKGGGGNESAILIFEAKDSLGNAIDGSNAADITITMQGDTVGARINPSTVKTDPNNGRVTINLTSGTKSGIILVTAKSGTVKSTPVQISVSGGQPVISRFTLSTQKLNLPAGVQLNLSNTITAVLGDTFGNPVQTGTVVYFSTTGGIIQPAAATSNTGLVSVGMVTGNQTLAGGIAVVTAQVGTSTLTTTGVQRMDESVIVKPLRSKSGLSKSLGKLESDAATSVIRKSVNIVFSGAPIITSTIDTFTVDPVTPKEIQITVADGNGNPMSEGTTVKITGVGLDTTGAVLSGNVLNTIPDTDDKNYTKFNISVADKRTKNLDRDVKLLLDIEVSGPNGNKKKTIVGHLVAQGSAGGKVGSITMDTTTIGPLVVNGAGSPTSDTVNVQVLDANDIPSPGIPLTFTMIKTVGGGEYLSTSMATTNASGIASVMFHSGIRAGTVLVQASYDNGETSIKSDIKSITIKTGAIASLSLVSASTTSLSVKGGGGNESAILVFEAKDSLGNAIDGANAATITMTMQGDTAGARVNPSTVKTDPNNGRITTNVTSGIRSGIILVTAQSGVIKSTPMQISVSGGQPVISRFTLSSQKRNLPAGVQLNLSNTITAVLGDTFGNPVQTGTVVYFGTDGGIIQPAATTSITGLVSVGLVTGNPFPPAGVATVTASVGTSAAASTGVQRMDESVIVKQLRTKLTSSKTGKNLRPDGATSVLSKSVNIVFSGSPIIGASIDTFTVDPVTPANIQITVADENGNPMAEGTTVKVTGVGLDTTGAVLSGNVLNTIPDTDDKNYTKFNISVADRRTKNLDVDVKILVDIEVTGPNGNKKKTIVGHLVPQGSAGGKVGTITMDTTTVGPLVVNGAGSPTVDTVKVRVLDASNVPSPGIPLNFTMVKSVGGGEYLSALKATTNASGIASVAIHSGIRAGTVQVQASYDKGESSIKSDIKSITIKTGTIASLNLVSASTTSLSVKGGGGIESAVLIFEAKDSLGNTIDASNQANITMTLQGDTSGARINPSSVSTDPGTGRITTSLTAGVQSGIILVRANSGTIASSAIQIAVSGGLPSQSQFTLTVPKKNYSVLTEKTSTISIIAGDSYGNPAKSGTLINFKTNGGLIDASAVTTSSGSASTTLQIVNPQPPGGIATLEARTFGVGGTVVRDTQTVIFSQEAVVTEIAGPYTNFEIEDGLSKSFQYQVADINGNPIAQGNTITVAAFGEGAQNIQMTGDINVTTIDTKVGGVGRTQFTFTARDSIKNEGQGPKVLGFKITVTGPNTSGSVLHDISGTLKGGTGAGNEGNVSSVNYVSSSIDTIFVANAGTPTTASIKFRVKNLLEQPVKNASVQFFFTEALSASEFLSPSFATSDSLGDVTVVLHSGIKAGILKVEAKVVAGPSTITSQQVPIYVKTGPLHSIALISVERSELSVKGVGGEENTTVTYEARDLLGNPLDFGNQTKLFFGFIGVSGNDEEVNPDSAVTNPFTGRVSVNVTAGTRSTVLQVIARNADSTTKSSPVPLVVHGGFTVDSLFTFTNVIRNISSKEKTPVNISMSLGDRYGNPVKPGTAVYFESSVGIIKASAFTDNLGLVQTTVTPAENLGLRKIIASTVGESNGSVNVLLKKELPVLMSGIPVITLPTTPIDLNDGSEITINFRIADAEGNPISADHNVAATVSGTVASAIGLRGDVGLITHDVTDTLETFYSLSVRDLLPLTGEGGGFAVTITVDGVTGIVTKTIAGTLHAPNDIVVDSTYRKPAQIAFISSTATDLSIAGVGALENALLTYEVRDSLGVPIDKDMRTAAAYSMQFFPNSSIGNGTPPRVIPDSGITDDQGKLRVSVVSGTQAGNMQIVVRIKLDSVTTITSQPVKITIHSGFPDQSHFTIIQSAYSFLGNGLYNEIPFTVVVGDTFSNPVATGTAVYFHTQAGVMQTGASTFGAYTDNSGKATVRLLTVNPKPDADPFAYRPAAGPYAASIGNRFGYHWVYAQTQGKNGKQVIDSVLVLQSTGPITTTGVPVVTVPVAQGGSSADIPITIKDGNGNPLPEGTVITVSVTDDLGIEFSVSGELSSSKSTTISSGSIFPGSGVTDFTVRVNDLTSGGSPLNTSCTVTITVVTPSTTGGTSTFLSKTMSFTAKVQ